MRRTRREYESKRLEGPVPGRISGWVASQRGKSGAGWEAGGNALSEGT